VRILIDRITPVRTETRARLMLTGLTGRAVVELTGGGKRAAIPLTADDGKDPVILSEPSPFSKLFNNGDLLLNNVAALAASGRQFLTPENAQAFAQVLQNLAVLTESMAKQTDNIERMVADMSRISADTQTALRQAASLMASTKDLVDSDGKSTLQALQRTLGTIDQTSRSLGLIATDNRQTIAQGMRGFAELGPVLKELRATLNALRGVARALEAGPANYLLGREQLQEFEP
jgi:phospholipid/cholesterol/gamma-HCH transport system substrate-binding protein